MGTPPMIQETDDRRIQTLKKRLRHPTERRVPG